MGLYRLAVPASAVMLLAGCQYMSYFKTNTTAAPSRQQTSAEAVCAAMGATPGNASFDWCVRDEELARGYNDFGF